MELTKLPKVEPNGTRQAINPVKIYTFARKVGKQDKEAELSILNLQVNSIEKWIEQVENILINSELDSDYLKYCQDLLEEF